MQILAIATILIFCAAVGVVSGLVGLLFGGITAMVIRGVGWRQSLAMSMRSAVPFVCAALAIVPFILLRIEAVKFSVPGSCALPNGYSIMVTDAASPVWVYRQRDASGRASVDWRKDGVGGVTMLQVSDRYILGSRDSHSSALGAQQREQMDSCFALDTMTGKLTTIPSLEKLKALRRSSASNSGWMALLPFTQTTG